MKIEKRVRFVAAYFRLKQPTPQTELAYGNAFELLVAVILSAQCTDKRVNATTPDLFKRFPTPQTLAKATPDEVFPLIQSISYPNNKAKHLVGMAQRLVEVHGGEVPGTMKELTALPGVGRKTANVILSVIFRQPDAIAVDTHVFRVARRLGLVKSSATTPQAVEEGLQKLLPIFEEALPDKLDVLGDLHHWLILHGRYTCHARTPACDQCGIQAPCAYFNGSDALKKKLDSLNAGGPKTRRKGKLASSGEPEHAAHSTHEAEAE